MDPDGNAADVHLFGKHCLFWKFVRMFVLYLIDYQTSVIETGEVHEILVLFVECS